MSLTVSVFFENVKGEKSTFNIQTVAGREKQVKEKLVNVIASVIRDRRLKRRERKGNGNGREDLLVISKTHLRQDYVKENRSRLQWVKGRRH